MKLHSQTMAGQGEPSVLSLFVEDLREDKTTLRTTIEETLEETQESCNIL